MSGSITWSLETWGPPRRFGEDQALAGTHCGLFRVPILKGYLNYIPKSRWPDSTPSRRWRVWQLQPRLWLGPTEPNVGSQTWPESPGWEAACGQSLAEGRLQALTSPLSSLATDDLLISAVPLFQTAAHRDMFLFSIKKKDSCQRVSCGCWADDCCGSGESALLRVWVDARTWTSCCRCRKCQGSPDPLGHHSSLWPRAKVNLNLPSEDSAQACILVVSSYVANSRPLAPSVSLPVSGNLLEGDFSVPLPRPIPPCPSPYSSQRNHNHLSSWRCSTASCCSWNNRERLNSRLSGEPTKSSPTRTCELTLPETPSPSWAWLLPHPGLLAAPSQGAPFPPLLLILLLICSLFVPAMSGSSPGLNLVFQCHPWILAIQHIPWHRVGVQQTEWRKEFRMVLVGLTVFFCMPLVELCEDRHLTFTKRNFLAEKHLKIHLWETKLNKWNKTKPAQSLPFHKQFKIQTKKKSFLINLCLS